MGQPFPTQHPAVVLRSHFKLVRAMLAVAMTAVLALSAAVVILATEDDEIATTSAARPAELAPLPSSAVHAHPLNRRPVSQDGGAAESARGIIAIPQGPGGQRSDGGSEKGTAGLTTGAREGGAASGSTSGPVEIPPTVIPQGPGSPR